MTNTDPRPTRPTVADHYDKLDALYRKLWGEHLHHGYWDQGVGCAEAAGERMAAVVADHLQLAEGDRLYDVGCGYGRMAADFERKHGVRAAGVTVSRRQWDQRVPGPAITCGDWLDLELADQTCEAVMAVESLEHLADPRSGLEKMVRLLTPGGRLLVATWVRAESLNRFETHCLLGPIQRVAPLPGMRRESDFRRWLDDLEMGPVAIEDVSREVAPTWTDAVIRMFKLLVTDGDVRRLVFGDVKASLSLGRALINIRLAYALGSMRYVIIHARRGD